MVNNFLFHEVSDAEREEIRKQAKGIMDNFSKKLDKVKLSGDEPMIVRSPCERSEDEGKTGKCNEIDRDIMFENAPARAGDFIVAEKGGWTE